MTFTGIMLGCILVVSVLPFVSCYTRRKLCLHFTLIATLSFRRKTIAFDYERSYSTDFTQIMEVKISVFEEGTLSR